MNRQSYNPYLPSWEYIPDGEPYVFDGRIYVYGSHDRFNGYAYCLNDYVCWSAPTTNLADWRYEGIIFHKTDDPKNPDGEMCLYAPDVTVGLDGRYYLYYVLDGLSVVSVAVCDSPAGRYEFLGYVHYEDGTLLGEKPGDQPQFDPGVLTEGEKTYLYTGFCMPDDISRNGPMVTVLKEDMLTIQEAPVFIAPSKPHSRGSSFEGHEFFEASSIRKIGETYYFIYSSILFHELCYAISKSPVSGFVFQGTIVSNNDIGIDSYKPSEKPMFYGGNNHGSIVEIEGQWYVFYHRHTNGTNYSRQGCIEKIQLTEQGQINQVEMTSCGANEGPLCGKGDYPAYLACNLFCNVEAAYTAGPGDWMDCRFPKITQEGRDGNEITGYIANMRDGATAGFKYFDCKTIKNISVKTRGSGGTILVKTSWNSKAICKIPISPTNEWKTYGAEIKIEDGIYALYFEYKGSGKTNLASFHLETGQADN